MGLKSLPWFGGQTQTGPVVPRACAKDPARRPSKRIYPNGSWAAFPGVPGGEAEVPAKSGRSRSSGWNRALPGAGWGHVSSLQPSVLQARSQTSREVPASSWHWSCGLPRARGWQCQGRERGGGVGLPYRSSVEETGRDERLRPGAKKSLVQVPSRELLRAQLG